ncbi:hypothetical protein AB0C65_35590 [Nocardia sp. NPDC048505]|uniref:hypothetical protein n=1 Tax=Nocardia sp. NPDC048505 TaxID=3155756 RepID=UPI0033F610C4
MARRADSVSARKLRHINRMGARMSAIERQLLRELLAVRRPTAPEIAAIVHRGERWAPLRQRETATPDFAWPSRTD